MPNAMGRYFASQMRALDAKYFRFFINTENLAYLKFEIKND